jgi:hypothetical protein
MCILSALALGVSAISTKEKTTISLWYTWWILGGVVVPIAAHTQPWLRHLSFNFNLDQIAIAVFRLGEDLKIAQDNVPILGPMLSNIRPDTMAALTSPAIGGALVALLIMTGLAAVVVGKRVKPE